MRLVAMAAVPLLTLLASPAWAGNKKAACPAPFVAHGESRCILTADAVIATTVLAQPGTHFDCQGHALTPGAPGVAGNVNSRSAPEVAFFLDGAQSVEIEACVVDGFDFGIFAIGGGDLAIHDSLITARFAGISFFGVSDSRIARNSVAFTTNGGAAIALLHGSQRDVVSDNTIAAELSSAGAVRVPGPVLPSNTVSQASLGSVVIAQTGGPLPTVFTTVIDGVAHQLAISTSLQPDDSFTSDNRFAGNSVSSAVPQTVPALFISNSLRTTVARNTISGASAMVIQAGSVYGSSRQFPGTCSSDASRQCLGAADCNIPGVDLAPGLGSCALPALELVYWPVSAARIEDNILQGPFITGVGSNGEDTVIRRNQFLGPGGSLGGVRLTGPLAIETSTVTANTFANLAAGLRLDKVLVAMGGPNLPATFFGSEVHKNDFISCPISVSTSSDYDLATELSVKDVGNYWGLTCAEGGFDPATVVGDGGSMPPVKDSHPLGAPVEGTDDRGREHHPRACY